MTEETALADALEFILAGRPERLSDLAVGQMPPEQRAGVAAAAEAIAALGLALEPVQPSPGLRARILASANSRQGGASTMT